MKKIIVLFVLALSMMSFSKTEEFIVVVETDAYACCTATVTYNGEYVTHFTECGIDLTLACLTANQKAKDFIKKQLSLAPAN